jgi:hypothetical protein
VRLDHLDVADTQGGLGGFDMEDIPEKGVTTVDVLNSNGHRVFSISVSTDGVAYQVLPRGEDAGMYTILTDEV